MFKTYRLSTIIAAISTFLGVIFATVFLYWSYSSTLEAIDKDKKQLLNDLQQTTKIILEDYIRSIQQNLDYMVIEETHANEIREGDWQTFIDHSESFIDAQIDVIFLKSRLQEQIVDMSFSIIDTQPIINSLLRQKLPLNAIVIHTLQTEKGAKHLLIFKKQLILPDNGQVAADLYAGILLNGNFNLLSHIKSITRSRAIALQDDRGVIATSEAPDSPLTLLIKGNINQMQNSQTSVVGSLILGRKPLIISEKETHLQILYGMPSTIFSDLEENFLNTVLLLIASFLVAFIAYVLMVDRIILKSLFNLRDFATKTAQGTENLHYEISPVQEFNEIGKDLETLINSTQELNRQLEERVDHEVEQVRQKDHIIYEQNRKNALNDLLVNIAHHWRQPLNYIALEVQSIHDVIEDAQFSEECNMEKSMETVDTKIANIMRELKSLSGVISDFTDFYRTRDSKLKPVSIIDSLKKTEDFFGSMLRASHVSIHPPAQDAYIEATTGDIVEIFTTLFINVRDVTTLRKLPSSDIYVTFEDQGDMLSIYIDDNAGGIDEELLPTLFDPYATSQFKSRNKGLSLFTIKNILEKKLNGTIQAENIESGARITITLKLIEIKFDHA